MGTDLPSIKSPKKISVIKETCPSYRQGHLPSVEDVERYRTLSEPHVGSFDFFLNHGLPNSIKDIAENKSLEIDLILPNPEGGVPDSVDVIKMWYENVQILPPQKSEASHASWNLGNLTSALTPRECRERGMTYAGMMSGDVCYTINTRKRLKSNNSKILKKPVYNNDDSDDSDDSDDEMNETKIDKEFVAFGDYEWAEFPGPVVRMRKKFGEIPIMMMSKICHLRGKKPIDLVNMKEEDTEFGGQFIVNGNEKFIRMLQVPRRNHMSSVQRSSYKNRGNIYSDMGVAIRCGNHNGDLTTVSNVLHYLTTGGATFKLTTKKQEFLIPVIIILRALSGGGGQSPDDYSNKSRSGVTDQELYERIVQGDNENTFLRARAELLLQDAQTYKGITTPEECLAFMGARFRDTMSKAATTSNTEAGHAVLQNFILTHLAQYSDKLECLILMIRKLYSFVSGQTGADNTDSLQNHELLLPGHLYTSIVKEKFEEILAGIKAQVQKEMRMDFVKFKSRAHENKYWSRIIDRAGSLSGGGIGSKVHNFLSTGNIQTSSGLDLMQLSGYTIVAERLNFFRYCAHFRSVHRGAFFMEMKTTAVRKLLPDQWGFLCPVHTPDGGPCGLLSHMALECKVITHPEPSKGKAFCNIDELLVSLGVSPCGTGGKSGDGHSNSTYLHVPVCLDGRVIGSATPKVCKSIAFHLRNLKVETNPQVPPSMEVAWIPQGVNGGPYSGLFLFTDAARMVRPVLQRATGKKEMIGPMEQPFMDIACLEEDIREGITTHQEIDPYNLLSLVASLTPYSDYNQSPRNMYQCQMAKQTMGTPFHSTPYRTDNKYYKLQNPQAPIVQTSRHGEYKIDNYPNGTNAVVAVLSYTGFDMEDSVIINKSSYERGYKHASVYKTVHVDLKEENKMACKPGSDAPKLRFGNKSRKSKRGPEPDSDDETESDDGKFFSNLGFDGFPEVGTWVNEGDKICSMVDENTGNVEGVKHKEKEKACIQAVRLLGQPGSKSGSEGNEKVSLTLRFPRNPVIGDKFASRHGQKGVMSILWPQVDMPFSESGISPDVIINPHAFPSRMTIGMLIESMAAKAGALHGIYQDATPFSFHESGSKIAVDHFGEQLQAAGYSYYGSEPLYSGVSGCLMHADLYIGVVYYQRLRHMVSDKYQCRATGKVNPLTRQPVKGRKKGGGIRLGEMERDCLLSHGAAFCMLDRLMNSSDRHVSYACRRCGDLLSPTTERSTVLSAGQLSSEAVSKPGLRVYCRNPKCIDKTSEGGNDDMVEPIALPYVYRYLANELAGMNIKMTMDIK